MAASGGGSGCSHTKFTKQGATDLGKLLAAEPIQEDIQVWIIDTRKHKGEAAPEPEVNPDPPKSDTKI